MSCTVPNEFKITLTLSGSDADSPWVILDLKLYVKAAEVVPVADMTAAEVSVVGNSYTPASRKRRRNDVLAQKRSAALALRPKESHAAYLLRLLQHRLLTTSTPFQDIYDLLHGFCVDLSVLTLSAQAGELGASAWASSLFIESSDKGLKILHWDKAASFKIFAETRANEKRLCLELDPPLAGSASHFARFLSTDSQPTSRSLLLGKEKDGVKPNPLQGVEGLCPSALNFEAVLLTVLQAQAEAKLERVGGTMLEVLSYIEETRRIEVWMEVNDVSGACLVLGLSSCRQLVVTVDLRSGSLVVRLDRVEGSTRESGEAEAVDSLVQLLGETLNRPGASKTVVRALVPTIQRLVVLLMAERLEHELMNEGLSFTRENPCRLDSYISDPANTNNSIYVNLGSFDRHEYHVQIAIRSNLETTYCLLSLWSLSLSARKEIQRKPLSKTKSRLAEVLQEARAQKQIMHTEWLSKHILHGIDDVSVSLSTVDSRPAVLIVASQISKTAKASVAHRILQSLRSNSPGHAKLFVQPLSSEGYRVWVDNNSDTLRRATECPTGYHGRPVQMGKAAVALQYAGASLFGKEGRYGFGFELLEEDLMGASCMALLLKALSDTTVQALLQSLGLDVVGDCSAVSITSTHGWSCTICFNSERGQFCVNSVPYSPWSQALSRFLDLNFHVFSRHSSSTARASAFVHALVNGMPLINKLLTSLRPRVNHIFNSREPASSGDVGASAAPAGKFRGKVGLSKTIEAQKASSDKGSRGLSLIVVSYDFLRLLVGELQVVDLRLSEGRVVVSGKGTRWDAAQKVLGGGGLGSAADKSFKLKHSEVEALLPKLVDSLFL